jgi:predicted small lipoprotein YifL
MRRLHQLSAAVIFALVAMFALAGCGGGGDSSGPQATKVIDISINGENTDPSGQVFDVSVGQRIELDVTADTPGEIHVHSDPEQEFEYDAGSSTLQLKPIDKPGVVVVESHTLDKVILKLQVR